MKEILLNICLTAIALSLFKMLLPENSMKKQTNFLISCFFLASVMFFFTSGRVNLTDGDFGGVFSVDEIPVVDFDEEYSEAQRRIISNEMQSRLNRILAAEGIEPEEIYTIVNISDKYSISINEIRLVFPKSADSDVEAGEQEMEILKNAIHIVQKEVGKGILVTGEFREYGSSGIDATVQEHSPPQSAA